MPFPAFLCGFLGMEQVTNEKKILRMLVKQNLKRKIAQVIAILMSFQTFSSLFDLIPRSLRTSQS